MHIKVTLRDYVYPPTLRKTGLLSLVRLAIVPQVDELLGRELLPAERALCLGVAPLGDALPAEQMAAGCGGGVSAFF